ncbi:MAG: hypothetical protein IT249_01955 [Chitinophagaceae bacterium]|nr:hypothetical protein [Chitinophagaceae bacterium]
MDIYTPENMIRYLYKETSTEETAAIKHALDTNWILREKFEAIKKAANGLNSIIQSPRPSVIQSLLNYAGVGKEVEHH